MTRLIKITTFKQLEMVEVGQKILNLDSFLYPSLLNKIGEVTTVPYSIYSDMTRGDCYGKVKFPKGDFGPIVKEVVDFSKYPAIEEKFYKEEQEEVKSFFHSLLGKKKYKTVLVETDFQEGDRIGKEYIDFDTPELKETFLYLSRCFKNKGFETWGEIYEK